MAPIINDVATDLERLPTFESNPKLDPMSDATKKIVAESYKDLKSLRFAGGDKATVFDACLRAATKMPRWQLEIQSEEKGRIEGVASTWLLRFKDDFVVRLETAENDVVLDMRSKSRLGKGDLGANAARIHEYFALVQKEMQ